MMAKSSMDAGGFEQAVVRLGADLFLDNIDDDDDFPDLIDLEEQGLPRSGEVVPIRLSQAESGGSKKKDDLGRFSSGHPSQVSQVSIAAPTPAVRRRVMQEIQKGEYDLGLMLERAPGLVPGTPEFNVAYIRERYAQHESQRRTEPIVCMQEGKPYDGPTIEDEIGLPKPPSKLTASEIAMHRNPWVLCSLRDVESIFGIGFWGFLAVQVASMVALAVALQTLLDFSLELIAPAVFATYLMADFWLWRHCRMKLYDRAVIPALVVLVIGVVAPVVVWMVELSDKIKI